MGRMENLNHEEERSKDQLADPNENQSIEETTAVASAH